MEFLFIKGKVLGDGQPYHIRVVRDAVQHLRQFIHGHPSAAAAVSHQLGVGKLGGVEQRRIQYIDIEVHQNVVKAIHKLSHLFL